MIPRSLVAALLLACFASWNSPVDAQSAPLGEEEISSIAADAYIYAFPLVLMDTTRRVMTNTEALDPVKQRAPVNQFFHMQAFPDASFTDVVRPNADTLYSSMWFDVAKEPLIIEIPDSEGRYYLFPMLDLWSDIFASPGKRTTGTAAQKVALVGPQWKGPLPLGVEMLRAPTSVGWIIGRTQTNGKADYANVHKFQAKLTATPLFSYGKPYTPPKGTHNPKLKETAPVEQVMKLSAQAFFAQFAKLTKANPPHANDYPILQRMKRIGLEPGKAFEVKKPEIKAALEKAVPIALKKITENFKRMGVRVNHWQIATAPIGTYGTAYLDRAGVAFAGLGANVAEDAIYPTAFMDADGAPFDSSKKYAIKFAKGETPPVNGFWSLTMYNDKQFFAANPIGRFAIGDRDPLKAADDGSVTLYIQRESPGKDKESNWLPAPREGSFTMNLRLYWPRDSALEGTWKPAGVQLVK